MTETEKTTAVTAPRARVSRAVARAFVDATPPQLLQAALTRETIDPSLIRELMTLAKEWQADQARRAFVAALSDAKAEIKPIVKNRRVDFPNRTGNGRTQYAHEDFAAIADHIDPILGRHGLSYRHQPRQEANKLFVTCILSHREGHQETVTLDAPLDTSGNKNSIQQVGSTGTYLQRYTLKMALGLAVAHDDDGAAGAAGQQDQPQGGSDAYQSEVIGPGQLRQLEELILEHGVNKPAFLMSIHCRDLREVTVENFEAVKAHILSKRRRPDATTTSNARLNAQQLAHLRQQCDRAGVTERSVAQHFRVDIIDDLTFAQLQPALTWISQAGR
jgi:ERF superfamily protein